MSKFHWTVPLTVAACVMGGPAHADRFKEVVVVTHVDVDPQNVPTAEPLLTGFVVDKSRRSRSEVLHPDHPGPDNQSLSTDRGLPGHARVR
jgi:hypothetical protein